jgi:hypothetical protein
MPIWLSDTLALLGLAGLIALGVILLYATYVLVFRRERIAGHPIGRWLPRLVASLEVPILLLVVGSCALALGGVTSGGPFRMVKLVQSGEVPSFSVREMQRAIEAFAPTVPLLLALLAIRWIRHRSAALATAAVLLFGGCVLMFHWQVGQFAKNAFGDEGNSSLFGQSYYIPLHAGIVVRQSVSLAVILGALFAYALWRRSWVFILGGMIAGVAATLLSNPMTSISELGEVVGPDRLKSSIVPLLATAILGACLWLAPRQRGALLAVAGLGEDDPPSRPLPLIRMGFVALATCALLATFALGRVEQNALKLFSQPQQTPRSPALVNAWGVLAERFYRGTAQGTALHQVSGLFSYLPNYRRGTGNGTILHSEDSLDVIREHLTPEIRDGVGRDEIRLKPWLEAYEAAGHADYLSPFSDGSMRVPSFLNIRELSRFLALRARVRAVDGDWKGAVADIGAIHRFSGLDVDGTLVFHMINTAVRGIGNISATVYWQAFRDNPEAMRAMAETLDSTAHGNRRSFPVDNIRRYEPGVQPIVPFADIAVPGFLRATTIYQRNAGQFDMLRIAAALELYRHAHGDYPETLDALVPEFLPRVPLDAFDGRPLIYEVTETGLVLDTERHRKAGPGKPASSSLTDPLNFSFPKPVEP